MQDRVVVLLCCSLLLYMLIAVHIKQLGLHIQATGLMQACLCPAVGYCCCAAKYAVLLSAYSKLWSCAGCLHKRIHTGGSHCYCRCLFAIPCGDSVDLAGLLCSQGGQLLTVKRACKQGCWVALCTYGWASALLRTVLHATAQICSVSLCLAAQLAADLCCSMDQAPLGHVGIGCECMQQDMTCTYPYLPSAVAINQCCHFQNTYPVCCTPAALRLAGCQYCGADTAYRVTLCQFRVSDQQVQGAHVLLWQ